MTPELYGVVAELQNLFARVFRFAVSMTRNHESAEDIAQEALYRAIKSNELSDRLESDDQPESQISWLFRVARNIWLDQLKSPAHRKKIDVEFFDFAEAESNSVSELKDEISQAMQMMNQLPDTQRQVLYLHAVEELQIQQIADSMEMTTNAVKANLSLARKTMREKCDRQMKAGG